MVEVCCTSNLLIGEVGDRFANRAARRSEIVTNPTLEIRRAIVIVRM
jgi:hypothetical protein